MAEKLQTGGLVLRWETTREDPLLYVLAFCQGFHYNQPAKRGVYYLVPQLTCSQLFLKWQHSFLKGWVEFDTASRFQHRPSQTIYKKRISHIMKAASSQLCNVKAE